jgi:hypothetical protein
MSGKLFGILGCQTALQATVWVLPKAGNFIMSCPELLLIYNLKVEVHNKSSIEFRRLEL